MKYLILLASALLIGVSAAFPPAPHHEIYGKVRDESGTPLSGNASVRLNGPSGTVISGEIDPSIGLGVNYSLKVPMDAGTQAQLYQTTALFPSTPFTVEVMIDGVPHVPIEVQGGSLNIGEPGERTRLDLTLGVDSDGDGLPDSWEEVVVSATDADSIADVTPEGDNDGDGVSNYLEYLAGTYAFTNLAAFRLEIIEVKDGFSHMRFLATSGRNYTISSSVDGETWETTPFSFNADGTDEQSAFRSERIRFEDVYLPTAQPNSAIFRLHVY